MSNVYIFEYCSCGRAKNDTRDFATIIEFHHRGYKGRNTALRPSTYSMVACLRKGCRGRWKTRAAYVERNPLMTFQEWEDFKRLQEQRGDVAPDPGQAPPQPQ